jgi:flagellar basal-body rod protein FlgC
MPDGIFSLINISASGLSAQRQRLTTIASNLANASTTRSPEGGSYKRKGVTLREVKGPFGMILSGFSGWRNESAQRAAAVLVRTNPFHIPGSLDEMTGVAKASGVEVTGTFQSQEPFTLVYDPSHPDADENGYVAMPNVNVVVEMVDMIAASRAYEANLTAIDAAKRMAKKAMEI